MHVDVLYLRDDLTQCRAGLTDKSYPCIDLLTGIDDERLDFLCGVGGALRKFAHLLCDNGKALARFTGPRGFYTCIQCQKICLEGNLVDNANDV